MDSPSVRPVLIAPNVSQRMGGEPMKALQIFREVHKIVPQTIQITHCRNRRELTDELKMAGVHYVEETWFSSLLWKSKVLRFLMDPWFSRNAVRRADRLIQGFGFDPADVVIHQSEPNSPVAPRSMSRTCKNVLGPINGNIYYPRAFRHLESLPVKLRRRLHMPVQRLQALTSSSVSKADMIYCAGGERTRRSLLAAGCRPEALVDSVDCGVPDEILDRPRVRHSGTNLRFGHFGRLVVHKGTALIIESLAQTVHPVELDIVGFGPELDRCRELTERLGLQARVRFLDWYPTHSELLDTFADYRGLVLLSMEDANGMVVQEAMAMGLPPVCLDWGGPQLLVEHQTSGLLITPGSREQIVSDLAGHLDRLATDGDMAESFSVAARARAEQWRWSTIGRRWVDDYCELIRR